MISLKKKKTFDMLCMTRNLINCDMYHVVDVEIIDVEKTIPLRGKQYFLIFVIIIQTKEISKYNKTL